MFLAFWHSSFYILHSPFFIPHSPFSPPMAYNMLMFRRHKKWLRPVVSLIVLLLFIGLAVRSWPTVSDSVDELRRVSGATIAIGLGLVLLTFFLAALSYGSLAFRTLRLSELVIVELAATFINRLVPSGLGGLGVHGLYLHKRRHTIAQATAVVSVNNLLGMVTHALLLALVLSPAIIFGKFHLGWSFSQGWALLGLLILVMFGAVYVLLRGKLQSFVRNLLRSLRRYARNPHQLIFSALALAALTLTNILLLYLVSHAVGVTLDPTTLFIVYSMGVLLGTAVPTPGGLAGVEAGLVAGFMAYGTASEVAIAATLAFRLLTYWFPLIPGGISFYVARVKKYV